MPFQCHLHWWHIVVTLQCQHYWSNNQFLILLIWIFAQIGIYCQDLPNLIYFMNVNWWKSNDKFKSFKMSWRAFNAFVSLRHAIMTLHPCFTDTRAVSLPIPELQPACHNSNFSFEIFIIDCFFWCCVGIELVWSFFVTKIDEMSN